MLTLARNWWLLVLRGVAALAFGAITLMWPAVSLGALVILFGAYCLLDGCAALALAFMRAEGRTGTWLLLAILGITAGVLTFAYPGFTAVALYSVIAGWSIARGIVELGAAAELRGTGVDVPLLVFAGIASILFGVLMLALPAVGVLALVGLIAGFALVTGLAWIAFGVRIHRILPVSAT